MADRPAKIADVHQIASGMPHVKRIEGPKGNSIYQVGGKSFVFFRTPQPDAQDPETGERYADVIICGVVSPPQSWWNSEEGSNAGRSGSTVSSLANADLPDSSCPVTTGRTPMAKVNHRGV